MRKGLFLSRNQGSITQSVDVDALAARYADLTAVRVYDHFFGSAEQLDILAQVRHFELDALVFAGNSAAHFGPGRQGHDLMQALKEYGINANKITIANIDEQVALTHAGAETDHATRKAGLLIDAALAKVEICHAVDTVSVSPQRSVLVIGSNAGAVVAAYHLLKRNFGVYLIEKRPVFQADGIDSHKFADMLACVKSHTNSQIILESDLKDLSGWCGEYTVTVLQVSGTREIAVGGIVLSLADDTEWIAGLRPKLRLDTDDNGLISGEPDPVFSGKTKNPGVLFIPFTAGDRQLTAEALDARAAAGVMADMLDRPKIDHPVLVSEIDETVCGGCGTCVKTCAFSASRIDREKKISAIDSHRCVGCGNCVTACPTGARDLVDYPVQYVNSAIEILSGGVINTGEPKVLAFLCKNSGYPAADAVGRSDRHPGTQHYSANVLPLRIECGGNIDTLYILKAFEKGFDGVALAVCRDGHCHNVVGNTDMERRLGLLRAVLRSRHIDDDRMRIIHVARGDGRRLSLELNSFSDDLKQMNRQ